MTFGQIAIQKEAFKLESMPWTEENLDLGKNLENKLMGEDCLSLNIWTTANKGDNRPVLVVIHGGVNIRGSSNYDAQNGSDIALRDVVYVNLNYRLGIFGFLVYKDSLGEEVRGNFALQDQIAALKWIQQNISKFGGDPSNVTIMGISAGAINLQHLIASPAAKGLFNRAVCISFNAYHSSKEPSFTTISKAENEAQNQIGAYSIKDLRKMSPQEILNLNYNPHHAVIDGEILPMSFKDAIDSGNFNQVDLIYGGVAGDPYFFNAAIDFGTFNNPKMALRKEEFYQLCPDDALKKLYLPSENTLESAKQINNDYLISSYFYAAKIKDARDTLHSSYIYFFDHVIPDTPARMEKFGAFHTSDASYWLNHFTIKYPRNWSSHDYELAERMSSYLVNFVKTGNPNGGDTFGKSIPLWKDVRSSDKISFMYFGNEIKLSEFDLDKSNYWMNYVANHK